MTGIGSRALKLGLFALLALSAHAHAVGDNCQGDLFASPSTPYESTPRPQITRFSDLTLMQKEFFQARARGEYDRAENLKRRLDTQLKLTKLDRPAGQASRHKIYQVSPVSYVIVRDYQSGMPELVAFELNEELGGPLNIPVTTSVITNNKDRPAAVQIWHGYTPEPKALISGERLSISNEIATDGDLFFFSFLTLNYDLNVGNILKDPDCGNIVFDFGAGFARSDSSLRQFLGMVHSTFGVVTPPYDYDELWDLLRAKAQAARFNWRSGLNRLNVEKIAGLARYRLGVREEEQLRGRICILRNFFNGQDISKCETDHFKF